MPANGHYSFPPDLYYDGATHTWARHDGGTVTVGLDTLGLESLGDMAYVALHAVGEAVRRGEAAGSLEAAKMVGDFISPVSGALVARNEDVLRDPGIVNRDPYGAGWLLKIAPSNWAAESAELVHGDALAGWIEAEVERYRTQGRIE